jgi:hypothetical protein
VTTSEGRGWGWAALGVAAVSFYAVHAGQYLLRRQPENLLWMCHLGALGVGIGLLSRQIDVVAVGTLWLLVGLPLWLYDLRSGGEFIPTSLLTHVGGLIVGLIGLKGRGLPRGLWWKSVAASLPVLIVSRLLTPPSANINMTYRVHPASESWFPSHALYLATLLGVLAVAGAAVPAVLRRLGFKPPESR